MLAHFKTNFERLTFEGTGHRQHDIGQFSGGVHEEIDMNVEIERGQCLTTTLGVGVR